METAFPSLSSFQLPLSLAITDLSPYIGGASASVSADYTDDGCSREGWGFLFEVNI